MLEQFKAYNVQEGLFCAQDKILIAVSAGADSMCLWHLLSAIKGLSIGIAHCNFKLRGAASDADEVLVEEQCAEHQVPFHVQHFDTHAYAKEHKLSIQVAARQLRYSWFAKLVAQEGYTKNSYCHQQRWCGRDLFLWIS